VPTETAIKYAKPKATPLSLAELRLLDHPVVGGEHVTFMPERGLI